VPFAVSSVPNQRAALKRLAKLAARGSIDPQVRRAALALTSDCQDRDDSCEVEAIFNAVKHGDSRVSALARGLRYVADPKLADFFTGPARLLEMCENGSCGGDCDDHSALLAGLLGSIGYSVGLRAYASGPSAQFSHVYAVVGVPKNSPTKILGLDTTVRESYVGWEPPPGRVATAWIGGQP
jgi:hypothetical protein